MVRIYSPSTSSGGRHHPSQQFGGPGFHEPMFPPPPLLETAAPHGHLDHRIHFSPPPSPPPSDMVSFHGHFAHRDLFSPPPPPPPSHMVSLLPAPHPFISHKYSPPPPPPPPPPSYGHDFNYPQQFWSPPPPPSPPSLGYHHPPPPPHGHGHGHIQQFGRPASQEPMHFPPPAHESGAPFDGHPQQFGSPPPPSLGHHHPSPPSHGAPQQFGRSSIHEPMLSPPPAQKSGSPHLFISRNHSRPPPPPLHGHHHPPPPSHGHSHGHHHSQQFGSPHAFHEGMLSSSIDVESAASQMFMRGKHSPPPPAHLDHMFMRGDHSPPPPAHLDYYNHPHSPPSPPHHRYSGAVHHPHRFSSPALEMEAPHRSHSPPPPPQGHLHHSHSPPPPPPPPQGRHHSHSSPPPPPHSHHSHSSHKIESPHLSMDHLHRSHSPPPPPPPPHGYHGHSSPFHGFQHHGGQVHMHPPTELLEEGLPHYEPVMSGMGHPSHQFPGHLEGMNSSWLPSKEEHSPPHHEMGGGHYDHFNLQGHSSVSREMGGAHHPHEIGGAHHGRHSPPRPRSPPRKHRTRLVGPPSYPPFCAPRVPATHLSNAHPAHLAVPVW